MKIQNRNKKILSLAPKIRNTKNFRKKKMHFKEIKKLIQYRKNCKIHFLLQKFRKCMQSTRDAEYQIGKITREMESMDYQKLLVEIKENFLLSN